MLYCLEVSAVFALKFPLAFELRYFDLKIIINAHCSLCKEMRRLNFKIYQKTAVRKNLNPPAHTV
jgi:hypothetical protein